MILVRSDDAFQVPRTETQPIWSVPGSLLFRRRQSARISAWCLRSCLRWRLVLNLILVSATPSFSTAQVGSSVASRPPLTAFSSEVRCGLPVPIRRRAPAFGLQTRCPCRRRGSIERIVLCCHRTNPRSVWLALREARTGPNPRAAKPNGFDYYQFTVEASMNYPNRTASRTSARITAGWRTPSSLSGIRGCFNQESHDSILNEPTLASDNLVVLSLATQGEFYPLLKTSVDQQRLVTTSGYP